MKNAIVTGSSRGIGKAIARRLSRDGWNVIINYNVQKDKAEELAKELRTIAIRADVSSAEDVAEMFKTAREAFGHISLLVNNAGISETALFQDVTDESFERLFGVNVRGTFNCSRAIVPEMVSYKTGKIINISSIWGLTGGVLEVVYSSTKAAIIGMTRALAKELAPSGITVNCVAPGVIQTDMTNWLDAQILEDLMIETPIGRLGTPEDIAAVVAFLASPEAGFITGQVISSNGGMVI